ncbi:gamma-glutamyltransferase family protein [Ramlibacter henchirensis]|uniref:Gamma-glutamyltransferase family protein n=1 Tax=Ramlibacter henchirensis TaxID=204072 RepID=A0A4Z0BV89_9BURK|nr:gamma-glutamyltransferase family protein [Ramlibacter henchirensis]TFZ02632.1 gamma-glutamyltransferase family protein [Ramlibacter henchirensis]
MNWNFPHPSQRMPLLADNVVATSQPLAAQAGVQALAQGGNVVDAVVAAAAALTIVEPVMNGLGSDAFAMLWDGKELAALNASGRSPQAWTPQRFAGRERMPTEGWDSVTVPGAVSAWIELWRKHGSLPLDRLFAPAIRYATEGFAVSPRVARQWAGQAARLAKQPGFADTFLPQGRAPRAGERFRFPAAAQSLACIAASEGRDFYEGEIAQAIVAHARAHGGALSLDDLASHRPEWVEPLRLGYRGAEVLELPPNGQGISVQIALGILQHFDLSAAVPQATRMHLQIEAMKIAFADVYQWVTEPAAMPMRVQDLLDPAYHAQRARSIDPKRAQPWTARPLPPGNTVYIAAADAQGRLVSYIQSNFQGFGSGVVVPEVGVSLLNRGAGFSLDPSHPNHVAGGKRPFHTTIPAMLVRDGRPLAAFGVVGADMQPQGQVQVASDLLDREANPQAALDAPRWRIAEEDGRIRLEAGLSAAVASELASYGHRVEVADPASIEFGGGQLVLRLGDTWAGASDFRRDGCAAGF